MSFFAPRPLMLLPNAAAFAGRMGVASEAVAFPTSPRPSPPQWGGEGGRGQPRAQSVDWGGKIDSVDGDCWAPGVAGRGEAHLRGGAMAGGLGEGEGELQPHLPTRHYC